MTVRDDEEVIEVDKQVYFRMFTKIGGLKILIPYIAAISLFSYLELYRNKSIQKWANKVSKDQHD